ncbi:MAG: hypothetical protein HQ510_05590 [Candidatus Marinimicrobia bacterium]|nr:hypothetical protein [Candidatus Neomarinimicrobiota bacterium]
MGLASEMKNLSEDILASFKQRIKENEDLVSDVQKTLDGFRKDHQKMTSVINANAMALKKGLAGDEKERLNTYNELMTNIHSTITSIQKDVKTIQTCTLNMINEFAANREQMADELNKSFAQGKADRLGNEKNRMKEFGTLMKNINDDIKSINDEVLSIFKNTNDMLKRFENEHMEMTDELRAELSKNLTERVEYTKTLLNGFQKKLSEISTENQQMAQKLRKDLDTGEAERLSGYRSIMTGIHGAIKGIRNEVNGIQKYTNGMLGYLSKDRGEATATWKNMQDSISQIRKMGIIISPKQVVKDQAKKETPAETKPKVPVAAMETQETPVETKPNPVVLMATEETPAKPKPPVAAMPTKEIPVETKPNPVVLMATNETPAKPKPLVNTPEPTSPKTLENKILDYINKHPKGVKISEMEKPLGETRMKLGFIAKILLNAGKVQKVENIYFPLK